MSGGEGGGGRGGGCRRGTNKSVALVGGYLLRVENEFNCGLQSHILFWYVLARKERFVSVPHFPKIAPFEIFVSA